MSIQISALSSRCLCSYSSVSRNKLNPAIWSNTRLIRGDNQPAVTISCLPSSAANDSVPIYPLQRESEEECTNEKPLQLSQSENLWDQITDIVKFSGPAVGLWICGPLMGLIDTAVVGQGSSLELAALGPGTVLCDYTGYMFMFLSIATSNLVATSLARQDKDEVQHQISMLLFLGLACGILMMVFTKCYGRWALAAFTGPQNSDIIDAANTYVQIRGLVWPVWLVGWVAQSACLGMKDSLGPVKALAVAAAINCVGDVALCGYLGYGISGAAWATTVSQIVAAYMSIEALNKKGYNGFAFSVPSFNDFIQIVNLAAPALIAIVSKTAFYAMLVFFATSMGAKTVAAHQVMIQLYCICAVWGEPLSQTAQSFMPELMYGPKRNPEKVRSLLKSLIVIGTLSGIVLGSVGTSLPWIFPRIFSPDPQVTSEMHKVLIPFFIALCAAPPINCLEGTLMAGRDLKFLGISMVGITCSATFLLKILSRNGYGLGGCWLALVAFQLSLLVVLVRRLTLPTGILYSSLVVGKL